MSGGVLFILIFCAFDYSHWPARNQSGLTSPEKADIIQTTFHVFVSISAGSIRWGRAHHTVFALERTIRDISLNVNLAKYGGLYSCILRAFDLITACQAFRQNHNPQDFLSDPSLSWEFL